MNNKEIAERINRIISDMPGYISTLTQLQALRNELDPPTLPKPSWDDAPPDAKILVQNKNGGWIFGTHTSAHPVGHGWHGNGNKWFHPPIPGTPNPDWRNTKEFRPVPPKRIIDLSVLIESGIDCEFFDSDDEDICIGRLGEITPTTYTYECKPWNERFHFCRPRMYHVHAWMGGKCPLPEGLEVKVYFKDEDISVVCNDYAQMRWTKNGSPCDIIAFEVLGLAEGWEWQ